MITDYFQSKADKFQQYPVNMAWYTYLAEVMVNYKYEKFENIVTREEVLFVKNFLFCNIFYKTCLFLSQKLSSGGNIKLGKKKY